MNSTRATTANELVSKALAACASTPGLECIETLELDTGRWERPNGRSHVWYKAESGISTRGNPWVKVTAGNAKLTGDVQKPLLVWHSWREGGASLDPAELASLEADLKARAARQAEQRKQEAEAARKAAQAEWAKASPDCNGHPYLARKGIQAHGIRRLGDHLIVPLTDMGGAIHCVQRIAEDGDKRFTAGGEVGGHHFTVGTDTGEGPLFFVEGYSTGASVHEAASAPVVVCFNSGNLPKVAKAFRDKYPNRPFVICADDDHQGAVNAGRKGAEKAAQEAGGRVTVVFPGFTDPTGKTDFNDLHQEQGLEAVRAQLQGAAPKSTFTHVDLTNFMDAAPDPTSWAIDPLVPRGHVTLLGGHGEAGKSMLALTLAAHVATGERWAGRYVAWGKVLYLSLEDDAPMVIGRLKRIVGAYRLDPAKVARNLKLLEGTRAGPLAEEENAFGRRRLAFTAAMDELRKAAHGCGLVIVDNASDAYAGSENDRAMVRQFMHELADIARTTGAAVMLLAHVDKSAARYGANGNSYSGSTAWHNSARSRLALLKTEDGVQLVQEKLNLAKKADPISLTWTEDGVLIPDEAAGKQSAANAEGDNEIVLSAIQAAQELTVDIPTARTGPATTWHVLRTLPELTSPLRDQKGKDRFWAAMTRLERGSSIARERYKGRDRHMKERWTLAEGNSILRRVNPLIPLGTPAGEFPQNGNPPRGFAEVLELPQTPANSRNYTSQESEAQNAAMSDVEVF